MAHSGGADGADDPPDDDVLLVARIASGDRAALAALYDRHAPRLLALGRRILGSAREAEDLLHDVFLEVWRHAAEHDHRRGTVRTWLGLRMRSRALDRLRSAGRARVVLTSTGAVPEGDEPRDAPSAGLDRAKAMRALAALPPDQRAVLELAYFEGLTTREIAVSLSVPPGTVKSRTARALASLRGVLADRAPGGGSDDDA